MAIKKSKKRKCRGCSRRESHTNLIGKYTSIDQVFMIETYLHLTSDGRVES